MLNSIRQTFNTLERIIRTAKKSKQPVYSFKELVRLYLLSKFFKQKDDVVDSTINGFRMYSFDYSSIINLYEEIFIYEVYNALLISDNPLIIDGGANIGMACLYFKMKFPQSTVVSFEPNTEAFELLTKNVSINNITDVKLFNSALSDAKGEMELFIPMQKGSLNSTLLPYQTNDISLYSYTVKTSVLSSMFADGRIDLIKLDIEGEEDKVLQDLINSNTMSRVLNLIVEFHRIDEPETFFLRTSEKFAEYGFKSKLVKTSDSIVKNTFDLIVAFVR